jgi:hypothetical protein
VNSSEMMMDAESFDYTDRVFIMLCTRFVFYTYNHGLHGGRSSFTALLKQKSL